jgi:stage II sporulation protein D
MNELPNEPMIRVGIIAATTIRFELKGDFQLNGESVLPDTYTATIKNNIIHCTNECRDKACDVGDKAYDFGDKACLVSTDNQIKLIPTNPSSTFILKNVTIGIGFHWERKEDQEFEGNLTLQVEGDKIRAVNIVPLESYLRSVISSEMSAMNDPNLLNAHAIVSRSWLLAQLQKKGISKITTDRQASANPIVRNNDTVTEIVKWYDREDHDTFDVCADDHCQRYQGITKVISENATKAIEATRGKVLLYDDAICDARFSKCCGGISEDFENVWQPVKVPYLVAVRDIEPKMFQKPGRFENDSFITSIPKAFCNTNDPEILSQVLIDFDRATTNFYRWEVEYSQDYISTLIARKSGMEFGDIIDLIPMKRGNSGRIIRLKIIGSKKEVIVGRELEIRKWLSESHLYSSAFVVEKIYDNGKIVPSKFIFRGAGWGHGVGMCQIGAAVMSRQGYSPAQILEHYYKGASIKKIYT